MKNNLILEDEFFNGIVIPDKDWKSQLEALKIDPNKEVLPPETVWKMKIGNETFDLGTKGDFSLIIGKAKSKKSFFINLILSTYIQNETSEGKILYFDTEQSEYYVSKAVKRINNKLDYIPANLTTYHLRRKSPGERLDLIEKAIYDNDNLEFVVIDGIKDLITSINDEEQASNIASKLLKWTEERNIHIITVLHQNKSDTNARGHLGTELQNKAETVLSVTKSDENKNMSIVDAVYCRNVEPESFAFIIDENGLPNLIVDWKKEIKNVNTKSLQPHQIADKTYFEILDETFKVESQLKYSELQRQLKLAIQKISGVEYGISKISEKISYLLNNEFIVKHGTNNSPKAFYTLQNPNSNKTTLLT